MAKEKTVIYNNARANQAKELEFRDWILSQIPNAKLLTEPYYLPEHLTHHTLAPIEIANSLQKINSLSPSKRARCIRELIQLPEEIKVITSNREITVDFTIVSNNKIQFIEFHEKQHRIDSNKRMNKVYTTAGEPLLVPRYLQRLLRDIWRTKYLPNFKIVWWDWFEMGSGKEIFGSNQIEYSITGEFKISELI